MAPTTPAPAKASAHPKVEAIIQNKVDALDVAVKIIEDSLAGEQAKLVKAVTERDELAAELTALKALP